MSRFVRPSKYRHVYGAPAKRSECFDNVRPSRNANDSNLVKANPIFVGLCWEASGGGAFAVLNQKTDVGKLPAQPNLFHGHKSAVLDIDFHPFNDYIVASASEDTKVNIWQIPEVINAPQHTPLSTLSGHAKKVMFLQFHPVADNVLASVSADLTIKIWDIEKGKQRSELTGFGDLVQAISFSATGDQLAVTSKDKKLRIFDVRSGKITHEVANHEGVKNQRVVWLGNTPRVATTGFSKTSDRQLYVRDINNFNDLLVSENIDTSSGVLMPFYDEDSKMLYLAGKGDGNIRYYEMTDEKPWQFLLSQYTSTDPQRGMGWLPKRGVNVSQCEIARVYKLTNNVIEPISFLVPRKSDSFQDDIFPDAVTGDPALTADEFFDGKSSLPNRASLNGGIQTAVRREVNYTPGAAEEKPAAAEPARASVATKASSTTTSSWSSSSRSTASSAPAAAAASSAELEELKRANEQLKAENAELKAQVSALKSEVAQLQSGHAQAAKDLEAANARAEQLAAANADLEAKVQELAQHEHHHHHHHEEAAGDAEVQATEDYHVVDAAEAEQSEEPTHEAAGEEQDE